MLKEFHMSRRPSQQFSKFDRALRKFFLSAFVVLSFVAYALHERLTGQSAAATPTSTSSSMVQPTFGGATAVPIPTETPVLQSVNAPTVLTSASYKDGVYSGPQVDVYYGLVQVQATIQGGKIVGVDFLYYPSDRSTSQQIHAIPL